MTSLWAWVTITLIWLVAAAAVLAVGEVREVRRGNRR